jgi:hypothetical protein
MYVFGNALIFEKAYHGQVLITLQLFEHMVLGFRILWFFNITFHSTPSSKGVRFMAAAFSNLHGEIDINAVKVFNISLFQLSLSFLNFVSRAHAYKQAFII